MVERYYPTESMGGSVAFKWDGGTFTGESTTASIAESTST